MNKVLRLVVTSGIILSMSPIVKANSGYNVTRLYGEDRYKTSLAIAKSYSNEMMKNIIVANGTDFPDALTGSILSKKYNAPILLLSNSLGQDDEVIHYIISHLDTDGTLFVLGGSGSVSDDFIKHMKNEGFNNIERLGGIDRVGTNKSIINKMNVSKGTPVVIVNGYDGFADALSISSIAASKGYPIFISHKSNLPEEVKSMISTIAPEDVYIIGGTGSIDAQVVGQIKSLLPDLKDDNIIRLSGIDRYETSLEVFKYFNLNVDTSIFANGENFPDALSGSALAAKLNAPILLTNGQDASKQIELVDGKNFSNIFLLGGIASIDFPIEYQLKGYFKLTEAESYYVDSLLTYSDEYLSDLQNIYTGLDSIAEKINKAQSFLNINDADSNYAAGDAFFYASHIDGYFWSDYNGDLSVLGSKALALECPDSTALVKQEFYNISKVDANVFNTAKQAYNDYWLAASQLQRLSRPKFGFYEQNAKPYIDQMTKAASTFNSCVRNIRNQEGEMKKLRDRIANAKKYTI
ncbi:cell wall-binding repeat-containing protein [Clostridium thailandense]|uniref:cell wall-binding repeat-containing protein n=1 Tax=Clostridium thailandense TaxID=2794346 RepID=UPI003988C532